MNLGWILPGTECRLDPKDFVQLRLALCSLRFQKISSWLFPVVPGKIQ